MSHVIDCESVSKVFGTFKALDDVNIQINQGEVIGYLGPNGAGKSTTIRMLVGLSKPTDGSVKVFGKCPIRNDSVRARIGYSPGELRLDDRLTIEETLNSWSRLRGLTDLRYRDQLVERFAVDPKKQVRGLSTGNRRKVGLIGAFMTRPELLILDEPTNGLDPLMQEQFLTTVEEAVADGATVLLSSHVMSEVEKVANSIIVLRAGQIIATGSTTGIRNRSARRLKITFVDHAPPVQEISQLPGVINAVANTANELEIRWQGALHNLLRYLDAYNIHDLIAPEPDLAESFMDNYHSAGQTSTQKEMSIKNANA
jgi:hypothetical protein